MRRTRLQALSVALVMILTMFAAGCGKKEKKGKEERGESKRAESMLEDFCAFLRNGKYDRVARLIDGTSSELELLQEYQKSPAAGILQAASERVGFEIQNVVLESDEKSGTAQVVCTYIHRDDLMGRIAADSSEKEIRQAISEAATEEQSFTLILVKTEDWQIQEESAEKLIQVLFPYIKELELDTAPTTIPTPTPITVEAEYCKWFDESYNEVEGYHVSTKYVHYRLVTWNVFHGERFHFVFFSANDADNALYEGDVSAGFNENFVDCEWRPSSTLVAVERLCCRVYDENGMEIMVSGDASIRIFPDDQEIPVDYHWVTRRLVDARGNCVPGYHEGDTYVGMQIELIDYSQPFEIHYQLRRASQDDAQHTQEVVYDGKVLVLSSLVTCSCSDMDPLETGMYYFVLFDASGKEDIYPCVVPVLETGADFEYSTDPMVIADSFWTLEPGGYMNRATSVSAGTETIYYAMTFTSYHDYTALTFKLFDRNGSVIDEGEEVLYNTDQVELALNMTLAQEGEMKLEVYDCDGHLFHTSKIEVNP